MASTQAGYFPATRHPWPCFCFLLPLLVAYEGGVLWLGGRQPEALRNGADTWVRWALQNVGLGHLYWAPLILALGFLAWTLARNKDRPSDLIGLTTGMAIESVIFALGLWGMSRGMIPLLDRLGIQLATVPSPEQTVAQVVTFVGAGIYEEVLFRLLLMSLLAWLLEWSGMPSLVAVGLATLGSAALFSGAHHIGPFGEPFERYVFLFRMLAGVYFALLYRLRGFGIAVGAHAFYDIIVGVTIS